MNCHQDMKASLSVKIVAASCFAHSLGCFDSLMFITIKARFCQTPTLAALRAYAQQSHSHP